jgi:predicted transposase YbfD/YdcC
MKEPFMEESARTLLVRLFRDIPDPRMVGKISHKLHDILAITVCAVICGLDHWTQIENFGKAHEAWFRTFLELPNGIPSHDTFGKVLEVSFNEDQCRVRIANAAENLARIQRISLLLLKQEKTCKLGIQSKRDKAGYDRDYLLTLLGFRLDNDTTAT